MPSLLATGPEMHYKSL